MGVLQGWGGRCSCWETFLVGAASCLRLSCPWKIHHVGPTWPRERSALLSQRCSAVPSLPSQPSQRKWGSGKSAIVTSCAFQENTPDPCD